MPRNLERPGPGPENRGPHRKREIMPPMPDPDVLDRIVSRQKDTYQQLVKAGDAENQAINKLNAARTPRTSKEAAAQLFKAGIEHEDARQNFIIVDVLAKAVDARKMSAETVLWVLQTKDQVEKEIREKNQKRREQGENQ
jgi:hypothetical protein